MQCDGKVNGSGSGAGTRSSGSYQEKRTKELRICHQEHGSSSSRPRLTPGSFVLVVAFIFLESFYQENGLMLKDLPRNETKRKKKKQGARQMVMLQKSKTASQNRAVANLRKMPSRRQGNAKLRHCRKHTSRRKCTAAATPFSVREFLGR